MEEIVKSQQQIDRQPDASDKEILNNLDKYLNGKIEDDYEDYEEINPSSLPSPQFTEEGFWKIPGTSRTFKTETAARKAIRRYMDYQTQNQAARLLYGIDYEDYIYGEPDGDENTTETDDSEGERVDGQDGLSNHERIIGGDTPSNAITETRTETE